MLWRAVAAVAVTLAGCGGDGATQDDAAMVKEMLSASASVQQAAQPLYGCVPEEKACYTENGAGARSASVDSRRVGAPSRARRCAS